MKIYLDQNKWIDLAKSLINPTENPKYVEVASLIEEKSSSGEWVFPISLIHHLETLSRQEKGSRTRLAAVMSKVSKGNAIITFNDLQKDEFIVAFSKIHTPLEALKVNAVSNNYFAALGSDKPTIEFSNKSGLPQEKYEEIKKEIESFSSQLFSSENLFEQFMSYNGDENIVSGLQQDDIDTKLEWEKWREFYLSIEKTHRYKAFLIKFFLDHLAVYIDDLKSRFGKNREEFIPKEILEEEGKTLNFLESVPSLDVRAKLMYETFNNKSKEIDLHDHRDIAFLATAIPYCDVVITERVWKHYSNQRKLNDKYDTKIENDLNYLLTLK